MQNFFVLGGDVSAETKRTARNLLVASATAMFAVVTGAKLHEIFLLKGVLNGEAHAHLALLAILAFFWVSHWLNLRTDLAAEMQRRHKGLIENADALAEESYHRAREGRSETKLKIANNLLEPSGVDPGYAQLHYSQMFSYYYRGTVLSLGVIAIAVTTYAAVSGSTPSTKAAPEPKPQSRPK